MESLFCGTTGMSSTLSMELNRGEEHVPLGLLEHELHDSTAQYFYTALGWRCIPPAGPTGCVPWQSAASTHPWAR